MQKLILNVAAFLLLIALVIVAQAPDGAAPAFKGPAGPDAVAANLVSTVCASCHTLDRVKNKMADKDGWTTTVARMKEKGANLTDEQVPVVVEYLTRAASTLTVAAADGKGGGKGGKGGKGGGGGPAGKNLQVLTGNIPETMQSFVQALGLLDQGACAYCHVQDRSSDEKPQKVTARRMVIMLRAINGTFPDGKQHVTCFTCHRGSPKPLTEPAF
jgi:hypothetical protein